MFELLVVSSEDKRFHEWIKCFELLFDVTADQIMADYNELVPLVNLTTTTYLRTFDVYKDDDGDIIKESTYFLEFTYDDEPYDEPYKWITFIPNKNRFLQF